MATSSPANSLSLFCLQQTSPRAFTSVKDPPGAESRDLFAGFVETFERDESYRRVDEEDSGHAVMELEGRRERPVLEGKISRHATRGIWQFSLGIDSHDMFHDMFVH